MTRPSHTAAAPPAYVDPRQARQAAAAVPHDGVVSALAETFRALSDPTRIRIIAALSQRELCVLDLAHILQLTGSAISHQLRLLRGQRLVKYRKQGKAVYYALDDAHINHLFAEGIRHVEAR
jgi:ArsR family transcriptional regulator, lead/cadmium/zinc/bismuth-responsive transcriptional repressor